MKWVSPARDAADLGSVAFEPAARPPRSAGALPGQGVRVRASLDQSPDAGGRRERLVALCCTFPETEAEQAGAQHIAFKVRKKIFAYYTYEHHGDGRIALWCKAPPGEQARLVEESPRRYFVPPYVGPRGWVALRLDTPRVDWRAVENLAFVAYILTAPDTLRKKAGRVVSSGHVGPRRRRTRGPG